MIDILLANFFSDRELRKIRKITIKPVEWSRDCHSSRPYVAFSALHCLTRVGGAFACITSCSKFSTVAYKWHSCNKTTFVEIENVFTTEIFFSSSSFRDFKISCNYNDWNNFQCSFMSKPMLSLKTLKPRQLITNHRKQTLLVILWSQANRPQRTMP